MNEFGDLIRRARARQFLRLGELADSLGVSVSHLSNVERGRQAPFDEQLFPVLATSLGLSLDEIRQAALLTEGLRFHPTCAESREFILRLNQAWNNLTPDDFNRLLRTLQGL